MHGVFFFNPTEPVVWNGMNEWYFMALIWEVWVDEGGNTSAVQLNSGC